MLGPPGLQVVRVFGIGLQRVNRRIKARLRTPPVQPPKTSHIALGMACHRLGKISGGWADGPDQGERCIGAIQGLHACRTLVKLRQP